MKHKTIVSLVVLFMLLAVVISITTVTVTEEAPDSLDNHNGNVSHEQCAPIDLKSLEVLTALKSNRELDCLAEQLKTNPIMLDSKLVAFLNENLHSNFNRGQSDEFFDSNLAIISAYIVSVWADLKQGKEQGIKFDYKQFRGWLLEVINSHDSRGVYAAVPIIKYGSLTDLEIVYQQFNQFDEWTKNTVFAELSVRCDANSYRILEKLKSGYPVWWESKPELPVKCQSNY